MLTISNDCPVALCSIIKIPVWILGNFQRRIETAEDNLARYPQIFVSYLPRISVPLFPFRSVISLPEIPKLLIKWERWEVKDYCKARIFVHGFAVYLVCYLVKWFPVWKFYNFRIFGNPHSHEKLHVSKVLKVLVEYEASQKFPGFSFLLTRDCVFTMSQLACQPATSQATLCPYLFA